MVNENLIPKIEIVKEIDNKYKIPSFEEFMKTYENDGNLNYDDLNSGNVGEVKGHGPCIINGELNYDNCNCPNEELDRQYKIIRNKIELEKIRNSSTSRQFYLKISIATHSYFYIEDTNVIDQPGWKYERDAVRGLAIATLTLGMGIRDTDYAWGSSIEFQSVEKAREFVRKLERGTVKISTSYSGLKSWVISTISSAVSNYESGNSVNISTNW